MKPEVIRFIVITNNKIRNIHLSYTKRSCPSKTFTFKYKLFYLGACHPIESLPLSCEINYFVKCVHSFYVSSPTTIRSLYRVSIQNGEDFSSNTIRITPIQSKFNCYDIFCAYSLMTSRPMNFPYQIGTHLYSFHGYQGSTYYF